MEQVRRIVPKEHAPPDQRLQMGAGSIAAGRAERGSDDAVHTGLHPPIVDLDLEGVAVDHPHEAARLELARARSGRTTGQR